MSSMSSSKASTSVKLKSIREKRRQNNTCTEPVVNEPIPRSTTAKLCAIRHKNLELSAKEDSFDEVRKHGSETDQASTDFNPALLALQAFEPSEVPMPPGGRTDDDLERLTRVMQSVSISRPQGTDPGPHRHPEPEIYDSSRYFDNAKTLTTIQPTALLRMFEPLTLNLFKNAPHSAAKVSLKLGQLIERVTVIRARGTSSLTKREEKSLKSSPVDIRTVYKIFDIDPKTTIFATCPRSKCCATYPPTVDNRSGTLHYPLLCTCEKFGQICNSPLTKQHVVNNVSVPWPSRPFIYHHFNDHVASMLSRPGIEDAIQTHQRSCSMNDELIDIVGSPALRNLRDFNGLPFLDDYGAELRLIWAISVDWYNPFHNKIAGKKTSTGVINMICLSLPPELRTKEEHMYLSGLIPDGEPSVDATNNILDPLIYDMQVAYEQGIYFTRTYNYPTGRTTRSAIVPLIADTMGSKKVSGHCGHRGKYFCSRCRLPLPEIDNLDSTTWPPGLTREEHCNLAAEWLAAPTKAKRDKLVSQYGVRWSSLLRASYWLPSPYSVHDLVHIVLLGLVPRHCRELLGLNLKGLEDEDEEIPEDTMQRARNSLLKGSIKSLKSFRVNVLQALCHEHSLSFASPAKGRIKKDQYVNALLGLAATDQEHHSTENDIDQEHRRTENGDSNDDSTPPPSPLPSSTICLPPPPTVSSSPPAVVNLTSFITKQGLEQIRADIADTSRPTWQAALPVNFGCPEHGKLKADQWRTALEFDIPVSLVKMLSKRKSTGNIDEDKRAQRIVEHTLDLAIAMTWGMSRRTSPYHAEKYRFYINRYVAGIQEIYPDYNLKPKHHYALHLHEVLTEFGPLHGTWTFPTERLIGRLQKLQSNNKIGEMEITVLKTFCRRSNLRGLLSNTQCPSLLTEAWALIQDEFRLNDLDPTSLSSPLEESPVAKMKARGSSCGNLDPDIHLEFSTVLSQSRDKQDVSREVLFHHEYGQGNVSYTDFHTNPKHSIIYFYRDRQHKSNSVPAQIRAIFTHNRHQVGVPLIQETFFAIHEYLPSDGEPFALFPDFRAAIFHREPGPRVQVIRFTQVHCHANQRPWDASSVVMRPIDRELRRMAS